MAKTALITGASAGMGVEFARQLAAAGYDLILVARRLERLTEVAADITRQFPERKVHTIAADLSESSAPDEIYQQVNSLGLSVSFLVNNAGSGGPDLLRDRDWAEQAKYLELMMLSATHMCHLFVPPMVAAGFGRVINVASVAGRIALGGECHYGPSKTYLIALSEELALTVRKEGVNVSALCPGFTHTEFHAEGELAEMKASTPKFLWYSAATVVRDGIRAVEKGQIICLSGRLYRWFDPLFQSKLTRWLFRLGAR